MELISKYFLVTPDQFFKFSQLNPLYTFWNEKINVISRKDIENLYLHHVLHSLSIAKVIQFKPNSVILDAGTGGGFPGIPLAILFPETQFILVDSIGKKINVANAVIKELKLNNCITKNSRLEDINDKADFVVTRAVALIPQVLKWVDKNIFPGGNHDLKNGLLALKGGDLHTELSTIKKEHIIFNLSEYFEETFFDTKSLVWVKR